MCSKPIQQSIVSELNFQLIASYLELNSQKVQPAEASYPQEDSIVFPYLRIRARVLAITPRGYNEENN